ncbi:MULTISPECIES: porin [unclassified Halomonas]|uniref:porin n=1 Tax=unclassified Halomonas TaxID=2609666 RepID=UPI00209E1FDB|nr:MULTISPECIES: porin [unclassified Halomonas]MCP1315901.1 porin [Halomonas sp. 707D7]MCP1327122.1 porin [Halomonas sp. 707D4]
MKKTLTAALVAMAATQGAQAAIVFENDDARVDLRGKVQYEAGAFKYDKDHPTQRLNFGGDGKARLGTQFNYRLNDELDLLGKLEWQMNAEGDNDAKTDSLDVRYAWLGFRYQDQLEMAMGRTQSSTKQLIAVTDIFELFGSSASDNKINGVKPFESKKDDQLTVGYDLGNWDFRGSYVLEDERRPRETSDGDRDYQYSFSARYTTDNEIDFVGAYERQSFQGTTDTLGDMTSWGLGIGWRISPFYVGAINGYKSMEAGNDQRFSSHFYEVAAAYEVGRALFMAGYNREEGEDALADQGTRVDEIVFGVSYRLMKNAKVYAEYNLDRLDIDGQGRDDLYGVGLEVKF